MCWCAEAFVCFFVGQDKYGKTPLDYAHPWLAGELKEIMAQRERAEAVAKV
jgi:hypothetical protein